MRHNSRQETHLNTAKFFETCDICLEYESKSLGSKQKIFKYFVSETDFSHFSCKKI
jgi:hypothetical protein